MGSLFLFRMVPTILLLVISTALAAPRGNMTEDYMEGSEDYSGNSSEGSHDYLEGAHDYMVGPEDYSGNYTDYLEGSEDYSGNYTDYLEGAILERSDSLMEDRAINTCGCAPVSSSNRIVGGKEVNPKGKLPYQVYFNPCTLKETIVKLIASSDPMCSKLPGLATSSKIKLCAFAKDTDTCQGDSGGPLTVPENGKYTLVGVVSYGWGCASSTPGIYARVQGFLPWIKNLISSGECSGSSLGSSGATATTTTAKTAKPTTTASSNGYDYYSYYG